MRSGKLIAIFFLFAASAMRADDPAGTFDSANAAYAVGKYEQAIQLYEKIEADNAVSAELYFNLGNAYYKTNNTGKAILNYERARLLAPDDEDIDVNMKLASLKVEDKIEAAPQLFLSQWKSGITDIMNEKEWSITMICLLILSLSLFALYVISLRKGIKQVGFYGGTALMLAAAFCFFMGKSTYTSAVNSNAAVITSASVTVSGSPSEKGTKLFILHEGTKVEITDKNEEWTEIRIANGNVGWVKNTNLEEI